MGAAGAVKVAIDEGQWVFCAPLTCGGKRWPQGPPPCAGSLWLHTVVAMSEAERREVGGSCGAGV